MLGDRRPFITDLNESGHQPIVAGDNVLIFNGEIYNHIELRKELLARGVVFRSRSDTEVVLRGYCAWGQEVVTKLKGMFAFAIWDNTQHRLFCGRDPFGKKPFYYHWSNGRFVFASEVEAVVVGMDSRPDPDYYGLSHYLLKGYFASGWSVYDSIFTLQAGHCLELDIREREIRQWPPWQGKFELGRSPRVGPEE